jgi:hypothetical protein
MLFLSSFYCERYEINSPPKQISNLNKIAIITTVFLCLPIGIAIGNLTKKPTEETSNPSLENKESTKDKDYKITQLKEQIKILENIIDSNKNAYNIASNNKLHTDILNSQKKIYNNLEVKNTETNKKLQQAEEKIENLKEHLESLKKEYESKINKISTENQYLENERKENFDKHMTVLTQLKAKEKEFASWKKYHNSQTQHIENLNLKLNNEISRLEAQVRFLKAIKAV